MYGISLHFGGLKQYKWRCPWTKQSGIWRLYKEDGVCEPSEAGIDAFSKEIVLDKLWVGCGHKSIKGPSPLTWFTITIENSNTSKYSTGEKGERGKRKQSLFIEGTLLWYFFLPSYLSKQHKCNCLSKTNEAVKSHRPRYRLAFIDLWSLPFKARSLRFCETHTLFLFFKSLKVPIFLISFDPYFAPNFNLSRPLFFPSKSTQKGKRNDFFPF